MEIPLTRGLHATIDDEDLPLVSSYKWHALKGKRGTWYAASTIWPSRKTLLMHRLIAGTPPGVKTDHRDRDGLNNKRSNLRSATDAQNGANKISGRPAKSGYRGVFFHATNRGSKHYFVRVGNKKGQRLYGGRYFLTAEEAAHRYDELAKQLYGEFAVLNFPGL